MIRGMSYQHKQIGKLSLVAHAIGFAITFWVFSIVSLDTHAVTGRWMMFGLLTMLSVTAFTFSSLTTAVNDHEFRAGFGPLRWPDRRVALSEIAGVVPTRTAPLAGWGVRITVRGWLYSVSGRDAIIVGLRNGKQFLIGTDDPVGLADAINGALPQEPVFWQIRGAK